MISTIRPLRLSSSIPRQLRLASTRHRQAPTAIQQQVPPQSVNVETKLRDLNEKPQSFTAFYSTPDLARYTLLSYITAHKSLLTIAIKLMPYVPWPLIKFFVCPIYTGGETDAEVRATGRRLLKRGIGNMMLSYAVEDADGTKGNALDTAVSEIKRSIPDIFVKHNRDAAAMYRSGEVITAPASGYIGLKPTGLMSGSADILANYDNPAYAEKWAGYLDVCRSLCRYADEVGEGRVVIVFDAEKTYLQKGVYAAQREMMREFNHDNKVIVCGTIQMYLQGSVEFLKGEIEKARNGGYQVAFKLVRGAYLHSEPDRDNVIHRTKQDTDASYDEGCNIMLDCIIKEWKNPTPSGGPVSRLVVASHNIESCELISDRMKNEAPAGFDFAKDETVVFGQLMGMNDDQSADLAARGRKVVKYVPWGPAKETKDYLVRRLEENGDAARGGWDDFVAGTHELKHRLMKALRLSS